tara:strand:+ start:2334 stop:2753 length:420 start_codon:yes stop_codon:yes gene_type:complete
MPYIYAVRHDLKLVHKRVWGVYSDAEAQAADIEWRELLAVAPEILGYDELHDLTSVTEYQVSVEAVRKIASEYNRFRQQVEATPSRTAYIVPSRIAFGTGRVYQALIEVSGVHFSVFEGLQEGLDWLGIQELPELSIPD